MIRFHSLSPWIAASICVAFADFILPAIVSICVLQVILQLAAFRWLAAQRAIVFTSCLVVATLAAGLIKWLVAPTVITGVTESSLIIEPIRIWVVVALGVALLFHADLQRVRKRRLRLRQQLQRKVRRRSAQIRRINDALRREVARRQATQQRLMRTETHLQSLAQRMQLQVLRKDIDGVITYANEAFCKNIGRSVDDVIGSTDSDLYPPATAEKYRDDDARVMTSGIPVDHVESHPTSDGKTGWVQVFKAPEYDQNECCIGIQMVFWDVTDTYWQTAELRRSEARKRALFDAAREAVMLVDAQGRIVEANPAAESLLGRENASVAGSLIESVAVPDSSIPADAESESWPASSSALRMTAPGANVPLRWQDIPTSERRELTIRRYDGSLFPAEVSVHPIPLENAHGLAVFIRDVTLRHQAIRALRDAKRAAEEANRMKSEFMAGVSHEIRTPLGGITGSAELLSRMELSPRAKQYVHMIRQSGELLSGVIGDILDFASIEAGRLQIDPEPTELHQCVGEAFRCLATRAAGSDIEMILSILPDVPRKVMVDAKRLRQIVINLAGNAIKFTPRGHVLLRLSTQSQPIDEPNLTSRASLPVPTKIVIEVIDSGIGIAKHLQEKIFEPFEQGDSGTTRRYGGTGLGLSISRQLIHQMGGSIEVTSRPGHGSTFRCILPLATIKQYQPARSITAADRSIAIEIAHPVQRRVLTELLTANGYRIDRTASLRVLDRNPASVAEHSQRQRHEQADSKPLRRIVWLSRVDDATASGDDEIDIVLLKPVMPDDLLQAIDVAASQSPSVISSANVKRPTANLASVTASTVAEPSQEPASGAAARDSSCVRILVVDDSEVNRTVIRDFLFMAGYGVDVVDSGAAAIIANDNVRYDCILMDLQMPEMDGVETMEMIHQRSKYRNVQPPPIVALTAHATDDHQARCLEAGMNSFLVKPIEPSRLIEVVRQMVKATNGEKVESPSTLESEAHRVDGADWQAKLLASAGGDSITMQALMEAFVIEVPQLCDLLQASLESGNAKEARRAAHTLKSCLKYVAPSADWQPILLIENASKDGETDSAKSLSKNAIATARLWTQRVAELIQADSNGPKSSRVSP